MAKIRFQTVTQFEYDTDTKKSRVIKHFSTPLGAGSWQRKKPAKQLHIEAVNEEEM